MITQLLELVGIKTHKSFVDRKPSHQLQLVFCIERNTRGAIVKLKVWLVAKYPRSDMTLVTVKGSLWSLIMLLSTLYWRSLWLRFWSRKRWYIHSITVRQSGRGNLYESAGQLQGPNSPGQECLREKALCGTKQAAHHLSNSTQFKINLV